MKKIIKSLGVIAAMSVIVIGATRAYFSDQETSKGNVLSAGTIDISVDGQNPWTAKYTDKLTDMKPSQVRYVSFTVKNVGANPVRVWKHLGSFVTATGTINEPECTAENGVWGGTTCTGSPTPIDNLDGVVTYDMSVCPVTTDDGCLVDEDGSPTGTDWATIIDAVDQITLDDIESAWIDIAGFLTDKALQKDDEIKVVQSYHIQADAGNEYQGDTLTFNIDILAQQLNAPEVTSGTLLMENKDASWNILKGDGTWGFLIFKQSNPTFEYTFKGHGLTPNTGYSLIYYADPWPGNHPGALLGTDMSDANGDLVITGNPDLGFDLPHPNDGNYPTGAKIWLVPSTCYNEGAKSVTCWPFPADMLFEYNLIQYDDTGP